MSESGYNKVHKAKALKERSLSAFFLLLCNVFNAWECCVILLVSVEEE